MSAESGSEQRTLHTDHWLTDSNPIQCFQVRVASIGPRAISWGH